MVMDNDFELVETVEDIVHNCNILESYLTNKHTAEYSYAQERIKLGRTFVVRKEDNLYKFFPSRFVGYKQNTMGKHGTNDTKDGKETNKQIDTILGKSKTDDKLDKLYAAYCESIGTEPNNSKHRFWQL